MGNYLKNFKFACIKLSPGKNQTRHAMLRNGRAVLYSHSIVAGGLEVMS